MKEKCIVCGIKTGLYYSEHKEIIEVCANCECPKCKKKG